MSICETIRACLSPGRPRDAGQLSPLALAYMGDTVYDLFVRTRLLHMSDATAHGLHLQSAKLVCARAQAAACEKLLPLLTEKESAVFRRGRNAHMGSIPRNASIGDYRAATGLEAVIGYLFIGGEDERLAELMAIALGEPEEAGPDANSLN